MTSGGEAEGAGAPSIPQSNALAEAKVESLSELMSRDPEGFGEQELSTIVDEYRAARKRWEAAELLGENKKKTAPKADAKTILKKASGTAEDLGL